MPELPEVEALARGLDERLRGRRISGADLRSIAALKTYEPPLEALCGLVVSGCRRRGKLLVIPAPPLHLVVHLARGGWVRWRDELPPRSASRRGPLALRVELEGGAGLEVTEQGTEKRLSLHVVRDPAGVPAVARLGVDVLDPMLDRARLAALLERSPGLLKGVLRDQSIIAGVGNAYSDEVLHAARLSPFRRASSLRPGEVARLHESLTTVLGAAVRAVLGVDLARLRGDMRERMAVHGRAGLPCPRCGDTIREVWAAKSSFQYCPTCQTGGRVLRDRRLSRLLR